MTRWLGVAALILMLAASARAGFNPTEWRHRKAIRVQSGAAPYAHVYLDGETYATSAPSFSDLRVVSEAGEEVPHVLQRWEGSQTATAVDTTMLNRSVLRGRFTRFELHVAEVRRAHTLIRLEVEQPDFQRRVTIEGSDDRRIWLVLAQDRIYRFTEAASAERTAITYPQALYRYLRITIHDEGQAPLTIQGASLIFDEIVPAREDRWWSGQTTSVVDRQARTTTVRLDLRSGRLPVSRLALRIPEPSSFAREAQVALSDDGETWQAAGRAALFRAPGAPVVAPLELAFRESRGRYVRVVVENADNPPVQITGAAVFGVRRSLLFPVVQARSYFLYLASAAAPPQYDLPHILSREPTAPRTVEAVLGPLEPNPAYVTPVVRRPWTEEHPAVLWGVLAVVILVLAVLIIGTARKAGAA